MLSLPVVAAALLAPAAHAQPDPPPPTNPPTAPPTSPPTTDPAATPTPPAPPAPSLRLDPVVVTARKWEEFAQDVPQGLSVVGAQTIRDAGIRTIRDAAELVPNLHLTEFSARRLSFPTFRGISTGVGAPSVTTYIDGVPQLQISSTNITLLGVERVEFLRGPQGTLFGRNSVGGVIKIETARPSNTFTFEQTNTVGNFDFREHTLSVAGPLVEDKLYFSVSGLYSERDGYTRNTVTGNRVDDRRSTFGRLKLLYTPDERNDFEFTTFTERSRDGGFALGFVRNLENRSHTIANDFDGFANRDILSNALTWSHYGEEIDFTSVSSYVEWDIFERSDFDFLPIDGVRRRTSEAQRFFYQEMRLGSAADAPLELGDGATLKWIAGGTLFTSDSDQSAANNFRPGGVGILFPAPAGISTQSGAFDDLGLALFGQATLTLDEKWDITAGLRYDYEDKEVDIRNTFVSGGVTLSSSSVSREESFDELAPTFSLGYHATEDTLLYARAARGFKAGGFNLAAPAGSGTFDTETSWTFEGGVKTSWFDDRLVLNAAGFYIDWEDLQLSLFNPTTGGFTSNAGEATSMGVEIDATARVAEGLDVFTSFGYTEAEFDSFVNQFGANVAGNNLAFVPETTFNIGAQFSGDLGVANGQWFARGEYAHTGTYFLDTGNTAAQSFGLTNFRAGVQFENVRVEGWVRNAFDDEYVQVAFQANPGNPAVFVGENGAPQTFGVTVSIEF